MKALAVGLGAAAVVAALLVAGDPGGAAGPRAVYVDYDHGSDSQDGSTPATAWKHAPGDTAATGRAAVFVPGPGAHIRFAPDVRYRGAITVTQSGRSDAPIVYESAAGGTAVISGADPVATTPCPDATRCGGAANWRSLVLVQLPPAATAGQATLFADQGVLRPAQSPDPADDFYRDEVADMQAVDGRALATGTLPVAASPGSSVVLWVRPNIIVRRPITAGPDGRARFNPAGLQFYTDRPSRFAIIDDVRALDRPGEYVMLPGGRGAVAMLPRGARRVAVATGRGGIHLRGASGVTIRNLAFEHMSDGGGQFNGIAILSDRPGTRDITIENARFRQFALANGQGPIILRGASGVVIRGNVIEDVALGSGMRLSGPASNLLVENNRIRRIGRTGIMLMSVEDALVRRNIVADVRGVHGNGLSAYLANHRVRFVANTVLDARQPATFRGGGAQQQRPNALLFANNLLVGTPDSLGSLIGWGAGADQVVVRGNMLLGGRAGLRLNGGDRGLVVENNGGVAPVFTGPPPTGWTIERNAWTAARVGTGPAPSTLLIEEQAMAPADWCARLGAAAARAPDADRIPEADAGMIGATLRCPR